MTRITWKLSLPTLPNPSTVELKKLANRFSDYSSNLSVPQDALSSRVIPKLRYIDVILEDILNEKFENISILEWLYCLYKKQDWDVRHPDKALKTAELIWKAAQEIQWLQQKLYWKLALYFDYEHYGSVGEAYLTNSHQYLPASLASSWKQLYSSASKLSDSNSLKILYLLVNNEIEQLADQCLQESLLPEELLVNYQLPSRVQCVDAILQVIPQQFIHLKKYHVASVDLLIRCLEKLSETRQVESVNQILAQVPKEIGSQYPQLIKWLKRYYGLAQPLWNSLCHEAKVALRKWIGAVNYADFQTLIDHVLHKVNLSEQDRKQLRSRREFWSNYSDRFERIRIILPQSTTDLLTDSHKYSDISMFEKTSASDTEVCIFDFGSWYVIEFFRGAGSETRLYSQQKYPHLETRLFQSAIESPNCLRCLGGEFHDHRFLWQVACEQWLRAQDIYPNDGITQFKRVGTSDPYDPREGLKFPSMEKKHDRDRQVREAQEKIQSIEKRARQSCCGQIERDHHYEPV